MTRILLLSVPSGLIAGALVVMTTQSGLWALVSGAVVVAVTVAAFLEDDGE